ncbi:MAG: hypothetical protein AAGN46_11065 [Acidobacteriota bacterium]
MKTSLDDLSHRSALSQLVRRLRATPLLERFLPRRPESAAVRPVLGAPLPPPTVVGPIPASRPSLGPAAYRAPSSRWGLDGGYVPPVASAASHVLERAGAASPPTVGAGAADSFATRILDPKQFSVFD